MSPANVELYIEELVLHGFAAGERHGIGEAVQDDLARLFAEQGVPHTLARGGEITRLDSGAFEVALGSEPTVIGAQVAQAVYRGLRQ